MLQLLLGSCGLYKDQVMTPKKLNLNEIEFFKFSISYRGANYTQN